MYTPLPICIHHSLRSNRKRRFILCQIRTVVHFATLASLLLPYQIRCSPFPFLKYNRVVLACAMIFPPIGFFVSFTNYPSFRFPISTIAAAPGSAVT